MISSDQAIEHSNPLWEHVWRIATSVSALTVYVTVATFLLYWRTAAPTVLQGDSGELQFAAWGFWLTHPTGYPLYLILGGLWQHLVQIGDPAFRLNLFSAFWSALAVGVAFLVFWEITRARGASLIAALTFAVSPLFWSQATRAEVYALNTFFVALLALWGILWREKPNRKFAIAFALTFGLALTHHRTTFLLIPAFAALFADRIVTKNFDARHFAKRALLYGALAALPLLMYLYIPLRAGATPYAMIDLSPAAPIVIFENSPRGWLDVILGSGFSGALGIDAATWGALRDFPNQWIAQLNPIGVLATLLGLGVLFWQRNFALAAFVLFGGFAFVLFNSVYHIGDISDYYTPIYFFACIAIAVGIAFITQQLRAHTLTRNTTLPVIALLAFLALLPLQNLFNNFFAQAQSQHTNARTQWARILASNLPQDAILISNDRDEITPLYYLQLVEKQQPNWIGLFPKIAAGARYENVIALVQRAAGAGRPTFAIKPIPALTLRYQIEEGANGLWRVKPIAPGMPQHPTDVVLDDTLRVRGYSLLAGKPVAGEQITLAIQYVPLKKLARNFTTSLQLFDAEGKKVAQGNDHVPGDVEYPSSKWRVGQVIQDQFDIQLDPNVPSGNYKLMLSVYDPSSGEAIGELTQIGEIQISD